MSASDWRNMLKQLKNKPEIMKRYLKYCKPKERKFGIASKKCCRCGRIGAHVGSYGLNLCRQCFRDVAADLGFKKYQWKQ